MNDSYGIVLGNGTLGNQGTEIVETTNSAGWALLWSASGITMVAGALGNSMVLAAIFREDRLQSTANYLIGSLAVTDLLVSLLVVPYSSMLVFLRSGDDDTVTSEPPSCSVFIFLDVTCCTASILHLCVIAWVRYKKISKIRLRSYSQKFKSVLPTIFAIWSSAVILSVAPFLTFPIENGPESKTNTNSTSAHTRSLMTDSCAVNDNKVYRAVATTIAFYAPLFFILVIYTRMARFAWSKVRKKPWQRQGGIRPKKLTCSLVRKLRRIFGSGKRKNKTTKPPSSPEDGGKPSLRKEPPLDLENPLLSRRYHERALCLTPSTEKRGATGSGVKISDPYESRPSSDFWKMDFEVKRKVKMSICENNYSDCCRSHERLWKDQHANLRKSRSSIDLTSCCNNEEDNKITVETDSRNSVLLSGKNTDDRRALSSSRHLRRASSILIPLVYRRKQVDNLDTSLQIQSSQLPKAMEMVKMNQASHSKSLDDNRKATSRHKRSSRTSACIPIDFSSAMSRKLEKIKLKRERKIIFTLGMVIGAFVVCWFPFFAKELIIPFCKSCSLSQSAELFINWLGYFNSALNPIIYTFTNKDFNMAFQKICYSIGFGKRQRFIRRSRKHATI